MEEILEYSTQNERINSQEEPNSTSTPTVKTTDTGYHHEDVLKKYVDIVFYVGLGIIILLFIVQASHTPSFEMLLGSLLIYVLYGLLLYVFRSFVYVFRNISINLHEMNMKMKEKEV